MGKKEKGEGEGGKEREINILCCVILCGYITVDGKGSTNW